MKVLNVFLKGLLKFGLLLLLFVYAYILSIFFTGSALSVVNLIWNLFADLPKVFTTSYAVLHLICSIPLAVVYFIIMIKRSYNFRKQSMKKD